MQLFPVYNLTPMIVLEALRGVQTYQLPYAALHADLDGERVTPSTLYSAVELIDHAADLLSDSAGLVHDNERRWRGFHLRIAELTQE